MDKKQRKPRKKKEVKQDVVKVAEVKVTRQYFDTRFNRKLPVGEGFECSIERAKELTEAKVCEIVLLKNSI